MCWLFICLTVRISVRISLPCGKFYSITDFLLKFYICLDIGQRLYRDVNGLILIFMMLSWHNFSLWISTNFFWWLNEPRNTDLE